MAEDHVVTANDPAALARRLRTVVRKGDVVLVKGSRGARMERVLECMSGSRRLRGASVYIDGFYDLTEFERRMVARLGKVCAAVEVTSALPLHRRTLARLARPIVGSASRRQPHMRGLLR